MHNNACASYKDDEGVSDLKNNRAVKLMIAVVAGIITFMAFQLYFNVDGGQISRFIDSDNEGSIRLTKSYESSEKSERIYEHRLEDAQLTMLISLLESTQFKRITSASVPFEDKERYLITAQDGEGRIYFRLESYGVEFILVDAARGDAAPKHWKLRIQNDDGWKSSLDEIIALSTK